MGRKLWDPIKMLDFLASATPATFGFPVASGSEILTLPTQLQEKYGDVFTVYLGPWPVIILCGYEVLKEALVDQAEAFSGRGHVAIVDPIFQGIECAVNPPPFSSSSVVFGERFNYQDPRFLQLLNLLNEVFTIISSLYSQESSDPERKFHHKSLLLTVVQLFFAGTDISSTTLRCEKYKVYPLFCKLQKHLGDYKGTTVYPIINSVLHDSRYFEKPDVFYPGHFLDVEGNFRKREAFIAFSMGNCLCSELFLFLTSILKNFSLGSPKAPEDIDLTPRKNGLGKLPPVYQLSFLPRWGEKEKGYSSLQRPCLQPPPVSTMNF
ncbi:Cytochrome P450 2G1 [Myotis brandtii]|uniref:Cytochrome P450 2G1 n=1 Tax=Myotis brandtii TaxID=109478 RepID=S7MXR8_MYOBR|nr:Cytochrome P450 2G1 [Myotis brandtii]